VAPLIRPAKRGGRPRTVNVREVLNAIFYGLWTGCPWKALPKDLPPRSTVWDSLDLGTGTARSAASITSFMPRFGTRQAGRPARPRPSLTARAPGEPSRGASLDPSGSDAGKTVPGRKRPILTHTLGLLLAVIVHPAPVQDRDGAKTLRREARRSFPLIARIIADAGDQGRTMEAVVARTGVWERQIVRRCDRPRLGVLPKRGIVERTLAWISRCRRLARDYERHARKAAAFVRLAMIRLRLRRLAARPRSKIQPSRIGS
jgi:transposase